MLQIFDAIVIGTGLVGIIITFHLTQYSKHFKGETIMVSSGAIQDWRKY